ncbi:MAG: hypothetical protein AAGC71_12505 [Pseudomonadota bacterium]
MTITIARRRTVAVLLVALATVVGCGGDSKDESGGNTSNSGSATKLPMPKGLKGSLIFERNPAMEADQVMRMDLRRGRFEVAADGYDASIGSDNMAFLQLCAPLAVRVAVTDADGFAGPVSECFELDTISPDLYRPKMHPDDRLIAVVNTAIPIPKDELPDTAAARFGIGDNTYAGVQIYDVKDGMVAELRDYGVSEWTRQGQLIATGAGGDVGYGIFKVDTRFKATKRLDDGRINGEILSIDTHPKKDRVVFIYNGQIFEMDLSSGKPKRIHSHGYPLAAVAYSPDGDAIVFVADDPLSEAFETPNTGYNLYVLRDDEVEVLALPFIPGGPLDWVD